MRPTWSRVTSTPGIEMTTKVQGPPKICDVCMLQMFSCMKKIRQQSNTLCHVRLYFMAVSLITVPTMECLSESYKVDNQGTEICEYKSSNEDSNKV